MSPSPDGRVRSNLLRERSEQAVLEVVFREGPITRPEIAARTNLSKPTVSAVVGRLEKADLVHATGERHGRRGRKPMAYVVSDRAGVVVDDEVVRGAHGAAGEICYLPVGPDPFDERHRLHGGLEDEIGAAAIVAAWRAEDGAPPASAEEVFERAREGDGAARRIVDHVARHVGVAIASVCAVIDPELVVLGGGIGSNALLLAPARATAAALCPLTVRIETSMLGEKAALQGATAVALREARRQLFSTGRRGS